MRRSASNDQDDTMSFELNSETTFDDYAVLEYRLQSGFSINKEEPNKEEPN